MRSLDDKLADNHDQQVDHGLEKAGDAAGTKVGHDDQYALRHRVSTVAARLARS